jgi:flagellar protein FlaF
MRGYGAYHRVQNASEPPRNVERRLLGTVTASLMQARETPADLQMRFDALLWNKKVWDNLAFEVLEDANRLPKELRGSVVNLAAWINGETARAMDGHSDLDMLIEINQTVMEGLA